MSSTSIPATNLALGCQSFGELLFQHRQRSKLLQSQLASAAQLAKSYVSGIENSKLPPPTCSAVKRLCKALGLSSEQSEEMLAVAANERLSRVSLPTSLPSHVRDFVQLALFNANGFSPASAHRLSTLLLAEAPCK